MSSEKGFSLIELLVVISIIGLLSTIAMTSMNGGRIKARRVSFQDSALSVQRMAIMCCDSDNGTLEPSASSNLPTPGDPICRNKLTGYSALTEMGNYSDSKSLGVITVVTDCNVSGFSLTMTPGTDTAGGWNSVSCDRDKCDFS